MTTKLASPRNGGGGYPPVLGRGLGVGAPLTHLQVVVFLVPRKPWGEGRWQRRVRVAGMSGRRWGEGRHMKSSSSRGGGGGRGTGGPFGTQATPPFGGMPNPSTLPSMVFSLNSAFGDRCGDPTPKPRSPNNRTPAASQVIGLDYNRRSLTLIRSFLRGMSCSDLVNKTNMFGEEGRTRLRIAPLWNFGCD